MFVQNEYSNNEDTFYKNNKSIIHETATQYGATTAEGKTVGGVGGVGGDAAVVGRRREQTRLHPPLLFARIAPGGGGVGGGGTIATHLLADRRIRKSGRRPVFRRNTCGSKID